MPIDLGLDRRCGLVIGQLQLDGLEARRCRRTEALDQRTLGEHERKIGGKTHEEIVSVTAR
jgi:hypothetical protein